VARVDVASSVPLARGTIVATAAKDEVTPAEALRRKSSGKSGKPKSPRKSAVAFISKKAQHEATYVPRAGWALGFGLFGLIPVYLPIVLALFAVILGWSGRRAYVRSGKVLRRNTMATVALVIGVLGLLINGGLFVRDALQDDKPYVSPPVRFHDTYALAVGNCYGNLIEDRPFVLEIIDCAAMHHSEVIARVVLEDTEYPGAEAVSEQGFAACSEQFRQLVGIDPDDSEFSLRIYAPGARSWPTNRSITCAIERHDGRLFEGSAIGSGR
jgi:hypothetical protein